MTSLAKLILIGSSVGGFAVGAGIGIRAGISVSSIIDQIEVTADPAPADFSARQFKYADTDHARTAVLFEIRYLEQMQRLQKSPVTDGELGIAYVRLAMVEETAGNATAAQAAFDEARIFFAKSHPGARATDEELKNTVRRIDDAWTKVHFN